MPTTAAAPAFVVTERFGPQAGEAWSKYVTWSGLTQLEELVSLDHMLCPNVVKVLDSQDWGHNIAAPFLTDYFIDLPYLLQRTRPSTHHNVLAIWKDPAPGDVAHAPVPDFAFCGFDLVERETGISALTNCGGFPLAFGDEELNCLGLLDRFDRAVQVSAELRRNYPEEDHAHCDLWAIWRREAP